MQEKGRGSLVLRLSGQLCGVLPNSQFIPLLSSASTSDDHMPSTQELMANSVLQFFITNVPVTRKTVVQFEAVKAIETTVESKGGFSETGLIIIICSLQIHRPNMEVWMTGSEPPFLALPIESSSRKDHLLFAKVSPFILVLRTAGFTTESPFTEEETEA